MKISVFGLGYVGLTVAVCLSKKGYNVIGADVKTWKVKDINNGRCPHWEGTLEKELKKVVNKGLLSATTDTKAALLNSDVSFICIGTPLTKNNEAYLGDINRVTEDMGEGLREKKGYHLFVIKSTIPIGVAESITASLSELSGKSPKTDFGVCVSPEFLREGSMIEDFMNPEVVVIGELDKKSGDVLEGIYNELKLDAKIIRIDIKTAEMVKYSYNAFHALKISFANELGNICSSYGIDANMVSDILCADHKLNISSKYLKPGFAFGGSCLSKDLHTLISISEKKGYPPNLLQGILQVNDFQKEKAFSLINEMLGEKLANKRVAILGVAFKEDTDDIRDTPILDLVKKLVDLKVKVVVYDLLALTHFKTVFQDKIEYISNLEETVKDADLIVVGLKCVDPSTLEKLLTLTREKNIVDLAGIDKERNLRTKPGVNYRSLFD